MYMHVQVVVQYNTISKVREAVRPATEMGTTTPLYRAGSADLLGVMSTGARWLAGGMQPCSQGRLAGWRAEPRRASPSTASSRKGEPRERQRCHGR